MELAFSIRELLERHHAESFGWALHCCAGNLEDAKDLLQTCYLKILEGKARYNGRSNFKTWWFGVVRNTALETERKRHRSLKALNHLPRPDPEPETDPEPDPAKELIRGMKTLSGRQAEVLQLVFYHEMTIEQAAGVLDISLGAARTHYERGKLKLKEWLRIHTPKIE